MDENKKVAMYNDSWYPTPKTFRVSKGNIMTPILSVPIVKDEVNR